MSSTTRSLLCVTSASSARRRVPSFSLTLSGAAPLRIRPARAPGIPLPRTPRARVPYRSRVRRLAE
ncbi:hypothetical protein [Streptomyces sp. enrichment culture]|uniref:hypothetical protein n=1 Tax=Streptomyces sp. enrichment culture TaxID=1795815 RepID=UPI003F544D7C